MHIRLLAHTPEPERVVAAAARQCYSAAGADDLFEELSSDRISTLVKRLLTMGHLAVLEHVSFTFAIEGVSRVLTHQLVRHRIASYSQQSQRYVLEAHFGNVLPPAIGASIEATALYVGLMDRIREVYDELVAQGISNEDARYVLPGATESKLVVTMNARTLRHFFELRCCTRAQWEIRGLANEMLRQARGVAPLLFADAGASCVSTGRCPEGELTCGRLKNKQPGNLG